MLDGRWIREHTDPFLPLAFDLPYPPPVTDMSASELTRRLGELQAQINARVPREVYDRDMRELRDDYIDLRSSYRKLVSVAVGEAFGLLVAIVLIAVQLALSVGSGQ